MWPFIETAYAMAPSTGGGGGAGMLSGFLPLILVFAIFWFLVIRPQQKKAKEHRALIGNVKEGDEIVTDSGIIGTLKRVPSDATVVTLEIAPKVSIRIERQRIAGLVKESRGKAPKEKDDDAGAESTGN